MTTPATADELLESLRRAKVVDDARLANFLKALDPPAEQAADLANLLVEKGLLTSFQASQALEGKPLKVGPYRVLDRLALGAGDPIYFCQHLAKNEAVAVKVLTESKAHDAVALQRFFREARAGTRLDHPNLVRVFDSDWEGDTHFLVMEFVDGCSLADVVKKTGPMPMTRAAHYIRQAAQGLQYAHEQGLVHRDLKPDNLLVNRAGVVKILDMGLARFAKEDVEVLTKGVMLGAPEYAAPEQGVDSHNVDIRADIYSLGAVFYYLLTGTPPYAEEASAAQKLLAKQTRPPKPVRELRPEVPHEIDVLIQIMMAQQPSVRYGTPKEVVDALAKWTRGQAPKPTDEELPPRRAKPEPEPVAAAASTDEMDGDSSADWAPLPEAKSKAQARDEDEEEGEEEEVSPPGERVIPLWQIGAVVALGVLIAVVWYLVK